MQKNILNDLHSKYVNGELKRSDFEGMLYSYYFSNQEKTCLRHWRRDEYEDYVSWFFHRLKKAIDSYKDIGFSFEAFMKKFLRVSSKEYRVRITTAGVTEYSTWSARITEMYTHESSPSYNHENYSGFLKLIENQNGRKNTRRILALIIKYYYYVSDDFVENVAPKIGINAKELAGMIKNIRQIRQKKDDELYNIRERIYCQYYRCIVFEKRLSLLQENTATWEKLNIRLIKAKKRLEKMRHRLSLIRTSATNCQVAEVIGVKKGTVDSSLHILKAKLSLLSDKSLLN